MFLQSHHFLAEEPSVMLFLLAGIAIILLASAYFLKITFDFIKGLVEFLLPVSATSIIGYYLNGIEGAVVGAGLLLFLIFLIKNNGNDQMRRML